ncbi:hypothetical protein D3OALGA1CA_5099 [Olavius algarvensis associated proteobacterium Delta 3]|nr:hypothetical protein D3OALGA1CA_5099 [Olavius algarvensis associated proteobacterium Delta 3]
MDFSAWMGLGLGVVLVVGAWTNWLNYTGDPEDLSQPSVDTGAVLFHYVFRKNRKAYRIFLYAIGFFLIIVSLTFCHTCKIFLLDIY